MERRKEDLTGTLPAEGGQAPARDRSPESPPRRKAEWSLGRPLKYAASSVVGCGVDLLLFTLFSLRWSVMLSTVAARCVSGYVNFKLNQVWSFQVRRRTRVQLVKYVLLCVCVWWWLLAHKIASTHLLVPCGCCCWCWLLCLC